VKVIESKQSIKRDRAFFQRQGRLEYVRVTEPAQWARLRETFYDQHTLRQLHTGRPPSFHDPRKRAFFDALFARAPQGVHVSALWLDEHCLAAHYGFVAGGTLYWGAPSIDIEAERAPGLLLLGRLAADGLAEGLADIDLTLGDEPFKARFGTVCVPVTLVSVYRGPCGYWAARARSGAARAAERVVRRLGGETAWARGLHTLRGGAASRPAEATGLRPGAPVSALELSRDAAGRMLPARPAEALWQCHANDLRDLILGPDPASRAPLVQQAVARRSEGWTLHTVVLDGRLVGHGFTRHEDQTVHLSGMNVVSPSDSRTMAGAVVEIVRQAFAAGVHRAVIALDDTSPLTSGLKGLGFNPGAGRPELQGGV
jgi:hypothetical protein